MKKDILDMEKLKKAIKKKALGYNVVEETVDYSLVDGEMVPSKKKTATRHIPPDVSALKALMDMKEETDYESMTDEELSKEKTRLLKILADTENK
ncbi:MAG TPA: hypothetical protein P5087_01225 [Eubacteriales bacterium]|nr:hypothetical protein [Eubacteriales bacterium]